MPTLNNYTVSPVTFSVVEGSDIYDTLTTATLVITPNQGFTVTHTDFSIVSGSLPDGIASAVFSQSGNNVNCVVTFENGFVMPSSNIDFNLCIDGHANEQKFTIRTWTDDTQIGGHMTFDPIILKEYNNQGVYGETVTVLSFTATADAGYEFTLPFNYIQIPNENYSFSRQDTFDSNGNLVEVYCEIYYTFPNYSYTPVQTENDLIITHITSLIFEEEPVITAYNISTSAIPAFGGSVNITVYGNPGATFSIERFDTVGSEVIIDDVTLTGYSYTYLQTLPAVSTNTVYEFEITGDLADTFDTATGQSSTFFVYQNLPITITIDATGTDLEGWSALSRTYNAYSQPLENSTTSVIDFTWNITAVTTGDLQITNPIDKTYWSNLPTYSKVVSANSVNSNSVDLENTSNLAIGMFVNAGTPFSSITITNIVDANTITVSENVNYATGTALEFSSSNNNRVDIVANATLSEDLSTVTITGQCLIEQYGNDDITFELDLDQFIEDYAAPTCVEVYATTGLYPGTVYYTDCSGNPQSFSMDANQVSMNFFGLSDSFSAIGPDITISLV